MNLSAFKAYDIRGEYPEQVNEDLAYQVGRAVVRHLHAKVLVVGRDMRKSSPSLCNSLISGIIDEGADAVDIGLCTTPMLNFSVAKYGYDGGIMVSASHNPGGDNAFKVIDKNVIQLDGLHGLVDIKNIISAGLGKPFVQKGLSTKKEVLRDYLDHIKLTIGPVKPLKVVFDYGNGVGSIPCTPIINELGINGIEIYANPDGDFPNHPANPHDLTNFDSLVLKVIEQSADLGVFFDGDADRANFVDDKGRVVPIDLLTVLLAKEILQDKPGKVYYDLRFSKAVPELIRQLGGEPVMMRVGNPFYKKALREDGGLIGSEFAGHIMFSDNYNIDDGLYAALKTIQMLGNRDEKLSKLIDKINLFSTSPEESMVSKNPSMVFSRLLKAFPEAKQVELDGLYLDFGDGGFISVRQSQNEPQLFRVRAEAITKEILQERFSITKAIVLKG